MCVAFFRGHKRKQLNLIYPLCMWSLKWAKGNRNSEIMMIIGLCKCIVFHLDTGANEFNLRLYSKWPKKRSTRDKNKNIWKKKDFRPMISCTNKDGQVSFRCCKWGQMDKSICGVYPQNTYFRNVSITLYFSSISLWRWSLENS